jgi:alpha-glucuronidase
VEPIESASNALAVQPVSNGTKATASFKLDVDSGRWDLVVVYFDVLDGVAEWEAFLNHRHLGSWHGNTEDVFSHAVTETPDGGSKVRVVFENLKIRKGDVLKVSSTGQRSDAGLLDYVAVKRPARLEIPMVV